MCGIYLDTKKMEWRVDISMQTIRFMLYVLFLIFILKLNNFSFIKLIKIAFYIRKSVAHYSRISRLYLRISNNYLTLSGFRFAKTLGSSIFSLNTWPTCKKYFRSRKFEKQKEMWHLLSISWQLPLDTCHDVWHFMSLDPPIWPLFLL